MATRVPSPPFSLQGSLLTSDSPRPSAEPHRRYMAGGAWVDHIPDWLASSDDLFSTLATNVAWLSHRRAMFDRIVIEPRLSARLSSSTLPVWAGEVLEGAGRRLARRYETRFGEPWANLYRDGDDSVAWHADRLDDHPACAVIAILSLGARRPLLMRPRGGGRSICFALGRGDLLVMGGTAQLTWEHSVPKRRRAAGPRISVTWRPRPIGHRSRRPGAGDATAAVRPAAVTPPRSPAWAAWR